MLSVMISMIVLLPRISACAEINACPMFGWMPRVEKLLSSLQVAWPVYRNVWRRPHEAHDLVSANGCMREHSSNLHAGRSSSCEPHKPQLELQP